MPPSGNDIDAEIVAEFRGVLEMVENLYFSSAIAVARDHPDLARKYHAELPALMLDLHRGLLVKLYVETASADQKWSRHEQQLGAELIEHLWRRRLQGAELRQALRRLLDQASSLKWHALVRPFQALPPLRPRGGEVEGLAMRLANIVAKIDGAAGEPEQRKIRSILDSLDRELRPVSLDDEPAASVGVPLAQRAGGGESAPEPLAPVEEEDQQAQLEDVLAELQALIGLDSVKHEVRVLTNFLRIQEERRRRGMPAAGVSLHMAFTGNPGTGKTTVARIVGRIYGALGVLAKGHVVETDRSGLVAEFVGQTGPKTNKLIDSALDGVLFIDEAYTLIAEDGQDAFGAEAVQTLLKRMEDDRERLVVILAGYPAPIERLLRSNPGLSSRVGRSLTFDDYGAADLGRIFQAFVDKNQYRLPWQTRARLLFGLQHALAGKDEHFGNARLVRNIFERSIRRQADRIVAVDQITDEVLATLAPEDLLIDDVPEAAWHGLDLETFRCQIVCPNCERRSDGLASLLGRRLQCPGCEEKFLFHWGEPVEAS